MFIWKRDSHNIPGRDGRPDRVHKIDRTSGPLGSWMVAQSSEEWVVKAGFQLPLAEGETRQSVRDRLNELEAANGDKLDFRDEEVLRLWAKTTTQDDILFTPTYELTRELCERLHGPVPEQTCQDMLTEAGFKKSRYSGGTYDMKLAGGHSISVSPGEPYGFYAEFHEKGATRDWNLMRLPDPRSEMKVFLPCSQEDSFRIGVRFIIDYLIRFAEERPFLPIRPKVKKGQKLPDLMEMNKAVSSRLIAMGHGSIDDYAKRHYFNFIDNLISHGLTKEEAEKWNKVGRNVMPDEVKAIYEAMEADRKAYEDAHPYQNFWHFFLEVFPDLENDQNLEVDFQHLHDEAFHDWQREIAKVYIDMFGAEKQVVRVAW